MTEPCAHPASFRDPAGFMFRHDNAWYRQVNRSYAPDYDHLMSSGLYEMLARKRLLIAHREVEQNLTGSSDCYKTLLPLQLPFISYPYEWSVGMLKDAALLLLTVNRIALDHGMILKDATPFNVQFLDGRPVLIDSLSFERYHEGSPWTAYRQFCECFLFPLYLAHYTDAELLRLLALFPEGIPVSTAGALLPFRSFFNLGVWLHVFLQKKIAGRSNRTTAIQQKFSRGKIDVLLKGLTESCMRIRGKHRSGWSNYYHHTILSNEYLVTKEQVIRKLLDTITFSSVLDLGANEGYFSRIVALRTARVISTDIDSHCVDQAYQLSREKDLDILPLVVDLAAPTPAIGLENAERMSFTQRAQADLVMALALVHHLALSKNIPLLRIAHLLQQMGGLLLIEFVPKEDAKARELLQHRTDIFSQYTRQHFETAFSVYYEVLSSEFIAGTERILYLMRKKNQG